MPDSGNPCGVTGSVVMLDALEIGTGFWESVQSNGKQARDCIGTVIVAGAFHEKKIRAERGANKSRKHRSSRVWT